MTNHTNKLTVTPTFFESQVGWDEQTFLVRQGGKECNVRVEFFPNPPLLCQMEIPWTESPIKWCFPKGITENDKFAIMQAIKLTQRYQELLVSNHLDDLPDIS